MTGRLKEKVAVVTGGSSGIGKAIALLFAREGARVACVASSRLEKAQQVVDQIEQDGGHGAAFVADIADWNQGGDLVANVEKRLGGIDILVTAAGVFYPTPAGDLSQDAVKRMLTVNLVGVLSTINAVVGGMKARGGGKIVCLSSVAGVAGLSGYSVYCATKFGVIGIVRALAVELAPHGINVNAIAPGNTETPMNEDIRADPRLADVYEYLKSRTPSRRVYSKPEDMARAALFLASDDGAAMYGSTILLDEGLAAGI
jgi:3-oxoacyl-[acyl-carrier protein] reductase